MYTYACNIPRLFPRLPFDYRTPFNFWVAFAFLGVTTYPFLISLVPVITFFLGSFLLFITFLKDISEHLGRLKKLTKIKKSQDIERKQLLYEIIKDFSIVKQLSIFTTF